MKMFNNKPLYAIQNMKNFIEGLLMGCLVFILSMVVIALRGLVVYLTWNILMPEVFGLPEINYGFAVGFVLLASNLCAPITNVNKSKEK